MQVKQLVKKALIPARLISIRDLMLMMARFCDFDMLLRLMRCNKEWRIAVRQPGCWTTFYGVTPYRHSFMNRESPSFPFNQYPFQISFVQNMACCWSRVKIKELYLCMGTGTICNTFSLASWPTDDVPFPHVDALHLNISNQTNPKNQYKATKTILRLVAPRLKMLHMHYSSHSMDFFSEGLTFPELEEHHCSNNGQITNLSDQIYHLPHAPALKSLYMCALFSTSKLDLSYVTIQYTQLKFLCLNQDSLSYKPTQFTLPASLECLQIQNTSHLSWLLDFPPESVLHLSLLKSLIFSWVILGPTVNDFITYLSYKKSCHAFLDHIEHLTVVVPISSSLDRSNQILSQRANMLCSAIVANFTKLHSFTWQFEQLGLKDYYSWNAIPEEIVNKCAPIFKDTIIQVKSIQLDRCVE